MNYGNEAGKPPAAKRKAHTAEVHGDVRTDWYHWLQDREDAEVMAYIKAENEYTDALMADSCEDALYGEMVSRIREDDVSAFIKHGGYRYYYKTFRGRNYPLFCRQDASGKEETLLDQNALAEGKNFCSLSAFRLSPDHKILMYSVDFKGDEIYTVYFKNLETGELLPDILEGTAGDCCWGKDAAHVFYTVPDFARRPHRVFLHTVGREQDRDVSLYTEENQSYYLGLQKSLSGEYLFLCAASLKSADVKYLRLDDPEGDIAVLAERTDGVESYPDHMPGYFLLRTNRGALNFKVSRAPESAPGLWEDYVPHDDGVLIEDIGAFESFLAVKKRMEGVPSLHMLDYGSGESRPVVLPERDCKISLWGNREFETDRLCFSFESFLTPTTHYACSAADGSLSVIKRREVPGYDRELYAAERVTVLSHDGAAVPLSLVYRKDLKKPEGNPLYLYGYGSYGYTIDADFSPLRLSLLDRGFVYALGHMRGGEDMGRRWYYDGKLLKKKNTFLDFIACAEYLIEEKWTCRRELVISGRSAGGLLVGAAVTMRPELFGAAVTEVPFVDALNTMLDESLPLTIGEYDEWGNPRIREYYDYIKSYSPYDNLRETEYPPMFVFTSLNDTRVMYWEPLKFTALMRYLKTDSNPMILRTDCESGHAGASGRYDSIRETAFQYAFIFKIFGIKC